MVTKPYLLQKLRDQQGVNKTFKQRFGQLWTYKVREKTAFLDPTYSALKIEANWMSHYLVLISHSEYPNHQGVFSSYLIGWSWYKHFRSFSMSSNWSFMKTVWCVTRNLIAEWTLAHTRYVPWSVWCSWGEFTPHLESQSHVNPTPLGSTSFWPFWPWSGLCWVSEPAEDLKIRRGN